MQTPTTSVVSKARLCIATAFLTLALCAGTVRGKTPADIHPVDNRAAEGIAATKPCLQVGDLDFGELRVGQTKSGLLRICNSGGGNITFIEPVITILSTRFSVSREDIERLRTASLGPSACVTITVSFTPDQAGSVETVARLWPKTVECRDSSVWTASVVEAKPMPVARSFDWKSRWLTVANNCTKSGATSYDGEAIIINTGNAPFTVERIEIVDDADGATDDSRFFELATDDPGRQIRPGDAVREARPGDTARHRQKIYFRPDAERVYRARIRIITTDGDTVYADLIGSGAESHITVSTPTTFPAIPVGSTSEPIHVTVTSPVTATRPLTITALRLVGADATSFNAGAPVMADGSTQATGPWVLAPGVSMRVPVTFTPASAGPKTAMLEAVGDHSRCDDSTGQLSGSVTAAIAWGDMRAGNALGQNDPNPFTAETRIEFVLARGGHTRLDVFDMEGRRVASLLDEPRDAGEHRVVWTPNDLPSGLYSYRITSGGWMSAKTLVLVR